MQNFVLNNLKSRHLNLDLHKVWVCEELRCATFPLYNLTGQLVGYQRYRPEGTKEKNNDPREGRYFTHVKEGKVGVWGLESWKLSKTLFVTEGLFDAARLTNMGLAAVATLSNGAGATTHNWLWTVSQMRPIVLVCDGDAPGLQLTKLGYYAHVLPQGEDMDSVSEEFAEKFRKYYEFAL